MPTEAQLLAALPAKARREIEKALKLAAPTLAEGLAERGLKYRKATSAADAGLEAVGFEHETLPEASKLSPAQRAAAEIFAGRPAFSKYLGFLPVHAYWRRRWLGLEKPGLIEGVWKTLPRGYDKDLGALLELKRPVEERLRLWWDIRMGAYRLENDYADVKWGTLDEITAKNAKAIVPLAIEALDAEGAAFASGGIAQVVGDAWRQWSWPFLKALDLAQVPFKQEWEALLPTFPRSDDKSADADYKRALYMKLVRGIPQERRGKAIIKSLGFSDNFGAMTGTALLADFPSPELANYIVSKFRTMDVPARPIIAKLKELGFDPKTGSKIPLELVVKKARTVSALGELSAGEKKQLEAARKLYDGAETPAKDYLETLEIRNVIDKKTKKPAFDVLLYMVDAGTVFKAGTTTAVASIAQGSLDCADLDLRESLGDVVGAAKPKKKPKKKGKK